LIDELFIGIEMMDLLVAWNAQQGGGKASAAIFPGSQMVNGGFHSGPAAASAPIFCTVQGGTSFIVAGS